MFEFRKRKIAHLPSHYKSLIDEPGYNLFLNQCLDTLKLFNTEVISSDDGDITYRKNNGEEAHYYLDNLLRKYIQLNEEEKRTEIESHFTKLQDKTSAYNYLFKDYDYAKQFIKILIKPIDISSNIEDFVIRIDYPKLYTVLIFDFEEQFHYIRKDEAEQWNLQHDELYQNAIENIGIEEIDVKEYLFADKYSMFILFSGDFSASYSLLIETKLPFTIGLFGSLIAIPTKGTAFLHPIDTSDIMDLVSVLYPQIETFYNEDPGCISLDFYWYYEGIIEKFNKSASGDEIIIYLPDKLKQLFK